MKVMTLVLCTCSLFATAAPAADCEQLMRMARSKIGAAAVEDLTVLYRQSTGCPSAVSAWLGQRLSAEIYNRAITQNPPDFPAIEQALQYGRSWQALATLGDHDFERKSFGNAAQRYQEALVEIADAARTPVSPGEAIIRSLHKKAEEAGLLASEYVPLARNRSGDPAALGASAIRGVTIEAVAIPVQFGFNTNAFTPQGEVAATDLADMLKSNPQAQGGVTLVGHTDDKGAADYNEGLSVRRAEALKRYLVIRGVTSPIAVLGMGERQPYLPDDPGRYSAAERDQMNRRVELRWRR